LELATPLFPGFFLLFASGANVLKGLASITSAAARASFNKNFAMDENLGDITAKAQTQGKTILANDNISKESLLILWEWSLEWD
jgi:hypothetical protein